MIFSKARISKISVIMSSSSSQFKVIIPLEILINLLTLLSSNGSLIIINQVHIVQTRLVDVHSVFFELFVDFFYFIPHSKQCLYLCILCRLLSLFEALCKFKIPLLLLGVGTYRDTMHSKIGALLVFTNHSPT